MGEGSGYSENSFEIKKTYRSANSSSNLENKNISSLPKTTAFKSNEKVVIV